jgi:predicted GIY-YIG superfamily endonuclease
MYYCYIIQSKTNHKFYIGSCTDTNRRLIYHNNGWSRYTKVGRPWELVFQKEFESKKEALQYERFLKLKKSHKYIENLIAG